MRKQSQRGFTLVELLVVIGIIVLLLAVLLPVLGKVKAQAQQVKCQANLRSIGQALILYVQQYNYYPARAAGQGSDFFAIWPSRLRAVIKGDSGIFYCPAQDSRCEWRRDAMPGATRATALHAQFGYKIDEPVLAVNVTNDFLSYGYNARGTGSGPEGERKRGLGDMVLIGPLPHTPYAADYYGELRANLVRRPAAMIAVADSNGDGNWDSFIAPSDNPKHHPGKVHNGGANVLFCDGHVQWYLQKDLILTPPPDLPPRSMEEQGRWNQIARMWNNHNKAWPGHRRLSTEPE